MQPQACGRMDKHDDVMMSHEPGPTFETLYQLYDFFQVIALELTSRQQSIKGQTPLKVDIYNKSSILVEITSPQ